MGGSELDSFLSPLLSAECDTGAARLSSPPPAARPRQRQNIKTESCNISTSIYMTFYSRKVVIKTFYSSSIIPDAVV